MTVSVVVPCHNAAPYLAQAIGSALDQTLPPHEVIVVDDASTDGSLAVAESFGDRVRVLSESYRSAPRTRNRGAALATGDALMFLDADDVLGPDVLSSLVDALGQQADAVAACPWFRLEPEGEGWVTRPPSCSPRRPEHDALAAWMTGWYHPPCSVLWSLAAFRRVGGWDPQAIVNNDGDIMMRAFALGVPLSLTERGAAYYRRLPAEAGSLSTTRFTEGGLLARVYVLDHVASLLEARDRVTPYRLPLADALNQVLRDAGGRHPSVEARCAEVARRYAGSPWQQKARRVPRRLASGWDKVRRLLGAVPPPAPRPEPPVREVRYGLPVSSD